MSPAKEPIGLTPQAEPGERAPAIGPSGCCRIARFSDSHIPPARDRPSPNPRALCLQRLRTNSRGINWRQERLECPRYATHLPRLRKYKSDWQISGKRRLGVIGHATGRVLDPACAAGLLWSPRRNRTGDPILTMDRQPSAVLTRIVAGRPAPSVAQLWGHILRAPRAGRHLLLPSKGISSRGQQDRGIGR